MGKGANLLNIKGILGNLYDEVQITDYWYIWNCLADDGHWTATTGTMSFSSDGVTITTSTDSQVLSDFTLPSNYEIEVTEKFYGSRHYYISADTFQLYGNAGNLNLWESDWSTRTTISNFNPSNTMSYVLRCQNNVVSLIYNGNTIISRQCSDLTGSHINLFSGQTQTSYGGTSTYQDIKVTKL